jgi:trans-aconitate 2-methyltransferase
MPTWDAGQYLQFADERTRPCRDLIGRIALEQPRRIVDLGCGPSNSTAALMARWPEAEITGLDSSPEMIAAAQKAYPDRNWTTGDIASWTAERPCDLLFSNAALQWVGDHRAVIPRLMRQVAPGGALAIQVPANFEAPAHRAMRELAHSRVWRNHFPETVREWFVHEPAFYYDAVAPLAKRVDLWTTEYFHVMENAQAIVEWYKGTGLRPFLDALSAADQERFLAEYRALLAVSYPHRGDGKVLFPFLRLFVIAYV